MSTVMKRTTPLLVLILLLTALTPLFADTAEASTYYYFKEPQANATFKVGDKIHIAFYAGVTISETSMDAWGRPSSTTYQTMPATLKVFKGSQELASFDFTYTNATTLETDYTPTTTGTLKFCIYARNMGLNVVTSTIQDTMTVKVKAKKASAVKRIKPQIEVDRVGKKAAEITCSNDMGFGIKIYRATKKNGTYKLIKTVKKATYTDKKLSAKKVYYYKVRLFAKSGKKTYLSKWSAKKVAEKYKPGITLSNAGSKGVKLSWKKIAGAGYYLVGRNTTGKSGEYEVIDCLDSKTTTYYDSNVEKGKTYYYSIVAEDSSSNPVGKYMGDQYKIKV